MSDANSNKKQVFEAIVGLLEDKSTVITDDTPLIGSGSLLDSMKLVELCLILEDKASALGFEFDWTSDSAMSRSRIPRRGLGSGAG